MQNLFIKNLLFRKQIDILDKNLIKTIRYNFCKFEINKKAINKKSKIVNEQVISDNLFTKRYKRFIKFSLFCIFGFLVFYISNGKKLFHSLQIDKRVLKKIKKKEQENNIDLEINEKKIQEFDEKFGINKPLDDLLDKINFGNKELNEKKDINSEKNIEKENSKDNLSEKFSSNSLDLDNTKTIDLTLSREKEKNKKLNLSQIQLNINDEKKNVKTIKGEDFEQISFSEGKFDNPDPRILGTTVVFDSRLNEK